MQSPSARKVWIEIALVACILNCLKSPSARKVWIEIQPNNKLKAATYVTFREEGVDWNCKRLKQSSKSKGHLPRGRCGLKFSINGLCRHYAASPSARKVWIEIWYTARANGFTRVTFREEGVDWNILPMIGTSFLIHVTFREEGVDWNSQKKKKDTSSEKSPSARKVWIEINIRTQQYLSFCVTFREEGVDWNMQSCKIKAAYAVTFREEGVDWNRCFHIPYWYQLNVTFREEGVDWNSNCYGLKSERNWVTFREEGVDWNQIPLILLYELIVTFREEGVDWNVLNLRFFDRRFSHLPRGRCGLK